MKRKPLQGAREASGGRAQGSRRRSAEPAVRGRMPSGWQTVIATLLTLLVIVVAFEGLNRQWRPARATIHLSGISTMQVRGRVTTEFSAYVQHVHVGSPSGQVDLALPVPTTQCQSLATTLGGACGSMGLTLRTSLDAQWDAPEQVTLVSHQSSAAILTAAQPERGGRITLAFDGGNPPRLCISGSLDRATLILGPGASPVVLSMGAGSQAPLGCDGLIIHVVSAQPTGESALAVDQIADASATLTGSEMEVSAADERFTVTPGDRDVSVSGPLTLRSQEPFSLTTAGLSPNLETDVQTARATSLFALGAERIPTEWQRQSALISVVEGTAILLVGIGAGAAALWLSSIWSRRRKERS